MSETYANEFLIFTVVSISLLFQFVLVILFCIFRNQTIEHYILDENSQLLSGCASRSGTDFSTTHLGYDHAYMSCQYYIRALKRLEYLQNYKQTNGHSNTFWFSLKDKELAKSQNKDRLLPLSSGNCILKVKLQPKMSAFIKNDTDITLDVALDVLLTDRESLLILNELMSCGSLRDQMLGAKAFSYLTRSVKVKKVDFGKPLTLEKICTFTKQILLGLIYLDKLRYPLKKTHLWLHAGNLMVDQGICRLSGYEVELLHLKEDTRKDPNEDRAGLNSVGQIVFEMATGFPVNYADTTNLDTTKRRLTLKRKEKLRELHFEYLKMISKPEVVQLVQFLCDEDKCASLHVSIHHPFFDQVVKFQPVEPDNVTVTSVKTLLRSMSKGTKSRKREANLSCGTEDETSTFDRDRSFGYSSRV